MSKLKLLYPKAKFLKPQADKIITLGKKSNLTSTKNLISQLQDKKSANKVTTVSYTHLTLPTRLMV